MINKAIICLLLGIIVVQPTKVYCQILRLPRISLVDDLLNKVVPKTVDGVVMWPDSVNEMQDYNYYDQWGRPIPYKFVYRDSQNNKARSNTKSSTAGYFRLHYHEENTGFRDPTYGDLRKEVLHQVCEYISSQIPPPPETNNCESVLVDLLINAGSFTNANGEPMDDVLGSATSSFRKGVGDNHVLDGEVWKVLNTGTASERNIYHGYVNINFQYQDFNFSDPSGYDLFSVLLHEITHTLGFHSFIGENGDSYFKSEIGKAFYSRLDLLMTNNGQPAIQSNNPVPLYDLSSTLDNNDIRGRCQGLLFNSGRGCSFMTQNYAVNAPADFSSGSSLSHFSFCGLSEGHVMLPAITTTTNYPSWSDADKEILSEIGYQIDGFNDQIIGGVDDTYNCFGRLVYAIEACGENPQLEIFITNNDGANADEITGVRILGEPSDASVYYNSADSKLVYTPSPTYYGTVTIQYVPVYNCMQGNITEVKVFNYPCSEHTCPRQENLPSCLANCNRNFYDYDNDIDILMPDGCKFLGYTHRSTSEDKYANVDHWRAVAGSPDLIDFSDGRLGLGFARRDDIFEIAGHQFDFVPGKSYLFETDLRYFRKEGSRIVVCPDNLTVQTVEEPTTIKFIAVKDMLDPSGVRSESNLLSYLENNHIQHEIVSEISYSDLSPIDFSEIQFCFTSEIDFNEIIFYVSIPSETSLPTNSTYYAQMHNFLISEIQEPNLEDQIISCGSPVSITASSLCLEQFDLSSNWYKNNSLVSTGLLLGPITEAGSYYHSWHLDGEKCTKTNFNVIANDNPVPWFYNPTLSSDNSVATSTVSDNSGNTYISGYFRGQSITFGGLSITNGNIDPEVKTGFLMKIDECGTVVWLKSLVGNIGAVVGNDNNENGGTVKLLFNEANNTILAAVNFENSLDYDGNSAVLSNSLSGGQGNIGLLEVDLAGNLLTSKVIPELLFDDITFGQAFQQIHLTAFQRPSSDQLFILSCPTMLSGPEPNLDNPNPLNDYMTRVYQAYLRSAISGAMRFSSSITAQANKIFVGCSYDPLFNSGGNSEVSLTITGSNGNNFHYPFESMRESFISAFTYSEPYLNLDWSFNVNSGTSASSIVLEAYEQALYTAMNVQGGALGGTLTGNGDAVIKLNSSNGTILDQTLLTYPNGTTKPVQITAPLSSEGVYLLSEGSINNAYLTSLDLSLNEVASQQTYSGINRLGTSQPLLKGNKVSLSGSFSGEIDSRVSLGQQVSSLHLYDAFASNFDLINEGMVQDHNTISQSQLASTNSVDDITKNQVAVFPNPFKDEFVVTVTQRSNLTVLDPLGRLIIDKKMIEKKSKINLSSVETGVYTCIISCDQRKETFLLLKK